MKLKKKVSKKTKEEVLSKDNIVGFRGGMKLDLGRKMKTHSGQTLRQVLSTHFKTVLEQEIENNEPRWKLIRKWNRMYAGLRDSKVSPWLNCANVAIPVTRSNADATAVRAVEAVWGKSRVVLMKAIDKRLIGVDREMEDWFNWFQKHILDFKAKLLSPIMQCVKTGTGIAYLTWEVSRRTGYRYATSDEIRDKNITKYPIYKSETPGMPETITEYNGPQIYPVDRCDFVISSDARDIQSAYLVGFKFPLRMHEVKLNELKGRYYKDCHKTIFKTGEEDETLAAHVKAQKKELEYRVDESKPVYLWELWVKFDVNEDGQEDDIVLTIHRETGTICDAIYNPIFKGFRPFIDLIGYPSEYHFDGEGVVEILEKPQIELDGLHNRRLDRLTVLNAPETLVKAGTGLENYKRSPGKVTQVRGELEGSVRELLGHDVYPSTWQEEQMLVSYMDRAVGITPAVMGVSTAERPVFRETATLQAEANKKFAFMINNIIKKIEDGIYLIIEMMAQYQPEYKYRQGSGEAMQERTVQFPGFLVRDALQIECVAATQMLNQEMRRERELTMYQLLSDYYTKTASMVQAITDPTVPPDFKKYIVSIVEKGDKRIEKILQDFDERDAETYTVNLDQTIDIEANLQPPPPVPPPDQMGGGGDQMGPPGMPGGGPEMIPPRGTP